MQSTDQTPNQPRTITVPVRMLEAEWLLPLGMKAIAEGDVATAQLLAAEIIHRMWSHQVAAEAVSGRKGGKRKR